VLNAPRDFYAFAAFARCRKELHHAVLWVHGIGRTCEEKILETIQGCVNSDCRCRLLTTQFPECRGGSGIATYDRSEYFELVPRQL